jgi:hypothetical protein
MSERRFMALITTATPSNPYCMSKTHLSGDIWVEVCQLLILSSSSVDDVQLGIQLGIQSSFLRLKWAYLENLTPKSTNLFPKKIKIGIIIIILESGFFAPEYSRNGTE